MYFTALATDYDGTIAHHGMVDMATLEALKRLKDTGRKLILVTGRELPDLKLVFEPLKLFDRVVAENGALLYNPANEEERPTGPPPPPVFVERLKELKVDPLSVGRSIVATWEPNETLVLKAIHELGLELQIIFNKGAVMVLPPSVNKATGLAAALDELGLSPHNVIGIGDAENDHAFLRVCGCAVAVANALPMVKETADLVTRDPRGAGVAEIGERLMSGELETLLAATVRHRILIGRDGAGEEVFLSPTGGSTLIAGPSGSGKSTVATALIERFVAQGFQFCVLDPEGDYEGLDKAVMIGDAKTPPRIAEALELLAKPMNSIVVNMLCLDVDDRPGFFAKLLPDLTNLRARTGHPHWIIVDEAHHMLPAGRGTVSFTLPQELPAAIFLSVHPDAISLDALRHVETVLTIGDAAQDVVASVCRALGESCPSAVNGAPASGEVLCWNRRSGAPPRIVKIEAPKQARKRHTRKYAEGSLGEDKSFYFRGPDGALNIRAQNLMLFLQIADGVDDATFLHHLRLGDYSAWFRSAIKDGELADEVAQIERDAGLSVAEGRARVREAVNRRYTVPASRED